MRRGKLRTRVLLLTGAFAVALFAISFGLSWRARLSQERWTRLISVETKAVAALEELIRAQNGFHARFILRYELSERYRLVTQLLRDESLERIDVGALRGRVKAYNALLDDPLTRNEDLDAASHAIVADAQQIIAARKEEIARQLPKLERETSALMSSGLAVAWILMLLSFAAVQITLRKVVQPIEELSAAADRVAAGDLSARAPVAGDHEIATLGIAFNHMADELKARARTDDLTALPNFRAFRERIDAELDRADRYPSRFGVLVLDLDRFKKYNDTYGHSAGNDALRRVSQSIRETVRAVDFPARYGGEEFAVIVPQIEPAALTAIAERIRANIEALPAPADGSTVTVSIGAAIYPDDARDRDALFQAADARLYEAKKAGRNRVVSRVASSTKAGAVALLLMFVAFQAPAEIVLESKSATTTTGEVVRFELGTLLVPENREKPDSRTIGVGFARIPAAEKGGTPVFILPGGPGESSLGMFTATDAAAQRRLATLIRNFGGVGDIVVVDQRGFSERGDKLEFDAPQRPLDAPRSLSDDSAALIRIAREAIVTHRDKDLSGYTVMQCAADVNDLRRELGYDRIVLIGQSFGSQWSFAIMRLYPEIVARALLSGVEPLDSAYDSPSGVFAALERIAKEADRDPRLKPWLPKGGVMAALHDVRKRLAKKPLQVKVEEETVVLGLEDFRESLLASADAFPALILSLYHGHYDEWAGYAIEQRRSTEKYPLIGPLIDSSLGVSAEREKRLRTDPRTDVIGVGDFDAYIASAPVWPTPDVGDAFRRATRSSIPVMFVNGDWDTSTPIENTLAIRTYFPNSRSILVHRGTHGARRELFDQNAEVREKVRGFLKTGVFPELSEKVSVAAPEFRLPSFSAPAGARD